MKLLLDEQVPKRLSDHFPEIYYVRTAQQMGWASTKNGALLQLASEKEFDAVITADKNMEYQQSSDSLPVSVIVMAPRFNRLNELIPLIPSLLKILNELGEPRFYKVES